MLQNACDILSTSSSHEVYVRRYKREHLSSAGFLLHSLTKTH